ncbi:hypothetical protein CLOSTMETH_00048 [[Clostridium] methylpentosum DSM 5476]|uniref:Uncharacterized protein n=1 Tax=[Clostridium] methylpentosum DSM 5476 TaxID=537013 RepID=C0E877_9FIRM|nr:hypothetical protein CLOSTMETH_00048 [[Clostridium] methylpentosum DSM 5476]
MTVCVVTTSFCCSLQLPDRKPVFQQKVFFFIIGISLLLYLVHNAWFSAYNNGGRIIPSPIGVVSYIL